MNHGGRILLLVCAVVLVSGKLTDSSAQARGPSAANSAGRAADDASGHAAQIAKLQTWLRRLQGDFQMVGSLPSAGITSTCGSFVDNRPGAPCVAEREMRLPPAAGFQGVVLCRGIGEGFGVSCRFSSDVSAPLAGVPLTALYGLDPEVPEITLLLLDTHGNPMFSRASMRGDALRVNTDCVQRNCPGLTAMRVMRNGRIEMMMAPARYAAPNGSLSSRSAGVGLRIELQPVER